MHNAGYEQILGLSELPLLRINDESIRMDIKEVQIILECIVCIWLVLSIATSVAIVILFYKAINKKNSRDTNCKRCKWLIKYTDNRIWPVICKKVEPGYSHEQPSVCGYFKDYQDGDQEDV